MHPVPLLQERIEEGLRNLPLNGTPQRLYEPVRYILEVGGKRMRPVLVLAACDLFGGDIEKALDPALGIELFHTFTLLHDDIMDRAPLRRGRPTVHERWDPATAILAGDVLFVKSFQLVSRCDDRVVRRVLDLFSETAIQVCEGQQMDLDYERQDRLTMDDYLRMITLKTSVLPAASLMIGALLAGASADDARRLYACGQHIGIAFQVMDDILDVYGDESKFGKQKGGDILANKKTGLLLTALDHGTAADSRLLLNLYGDSSLPAEEKIRRVKALFDKAGARERLETLMDGYFQKAVDELDATGAREENKAFVRDFLDAIMRRQK